MPLRLATGSKSRAPYPNTVERESPGAKSQAPHSQPIFPRKGHPIAPWLKYGCPVDCRQRAPPPKETDRSRRTRKGRTSRSAEVCFVAGRRGRAPQCPTLGPPHLPDCRTRGSSTARSPLVQSTTCLGLHLVTGSMVSSFAARWAGESTAESCSLCPRLSPCVSRASAQACTAASQPAIALRLSEGSAALGPCARDSCVRYGCSPQLPSSLHAAFCYSCFSATTAAAGARLQPQTPGRG